MVAVVHLLHGGLVAGGFGLGLLDDLVCGLSRGDAVGHLLHPDEEAHPEFFVGQLLGTRHGPESVGEVVVFGGRVPLDGAVAAVVVGQQQSFGRDQFARASAVEQHHGVLHRGLVDGIDVFGGEPESLGAHVVDARGDQAREPHALVGQRRQHEEDGQQGQQCSFHRSKKLSSSTYGV